MQPLPVPCPAHLIPDATGTNAFHDAYRTAMAHNAVFIAIETAARQQWTVRADTLTHRRGPARADRAVLVQHQTRRARSASAWTSGSISCPSMYPARVEQ
ncbi:hypothetical protein [Streptomyces sp. NPDC004546]|uniref:hypothetical protein n=1 Tax=unclassified Streptomyces TaxID=2593676 RepID=UPI0033A8C617